MRPELAGSVAGLRREPLVEQIDGSLRICAGREEVLLVLAAETHGRDIDGHKDEEPRRDNHATMPE